MLMLFVGIPCGMVLLFLLSAPHSSTSAPPPYLSRWEGNQTLCSHHLGASCCHRDKVISFLRRLDLQDRGCKKSKLQYYGVEVQKLLFGMPYENVQIGWNHLQVSIIKNASIGSRWEYRKMSHFVCVSFQAVFCFLFFFPRRSSECFLNL